MYELKVIRERRPEYGPVRGILSTSAAVYRAFREHCDTLTREQFVVLLLNGKNRLDRFHVVSTGTLTAALVHPAEVFLVPVRERAAAVVTIHNHPSGDPTPSAEDLAITDRLRQVGELLGIRLLDHVIVGDGRYVSLADQGIL